MDDHRKDMFAFPAVQEQEQLQLMIQSLAPYRRRLNHHARKRFEHLVYRIQHHLPSYNTVKHLSPMEFILLTFIIELLDEPDDQHSQEHPPLP